MAKKTPPKKNTKMPMKPAAKTAGKGNYPMPMAMMKGKSGSRGK